MFDPGKEPDDVSVTAGPKLLVITWSKFKTTKNGHKITSMKLRVIDGPEEGAEFFTSFGNDTNKKANWVRWKALAEYAQIDCAVDLDDDDAVGRCFHGIPFKAELEIKTEGKYTNVNIGRVVFARNLTQVDVDAIERWHSSAAAADSDAPPHDDQDFSGMASNPGGPVDDEIPF